MKNKLRVLILIFTTTLLSLKSQNCSVCSLVNHSDTSIIKIASRDTLSYTITIGKILCVQNTGLYTGKIILNGGVICNKGGFYPKSMSFLSGQFVNQRNAVINNSLSLNGNKSIQNINKSTLNIKGSLSINGGLLNNEGFLDVRDSLFNISGSLINKSIINCSKLSGTNSLSNAAAGVINTK